jgi:hypothetical protein
VEFLSIIFKFRAPVPVHTTVAGFEIGTVSGIYVHVAKKFIIVLSRFMLSRSHHRVQGEFGLLLCLYQNR